ncbi:succinylglutamate desuccinylase/aspartoacylase family protein [Oceanibacterium hippocampi]|uniref:Succinylglutamate desuccinylase / Aspartoacylase family protein n=1 Tax=Oceanibacterium hippocampi TaxID=745714 RepID=A0A1Y5RZY3_9PROT|nr:succinylglutamate desuccinylase/aspartoacylase family protein [Oceanibacterium hippocampi]SLN29504.1 Succinylglutamate desuccinylase / Aspartoacylase family protein [Oceanibacterium hippocampi]
MSKIIERIPLPSPTPGTRRELTLHRYGEAGARPKAYLQGSLHADETPGMLTLCHLVDRLDGAAAGRIRGEIVVVPAANPIGMSQALLGNHLGRYEAASGGNFNRGFFSLAPRAIELLEGRLGADPEANKQAVRAALAQALDEVPATGELAALRKILMGQAIDADIVLDCHCDLEALMHLYLGSDLWPDGRDLAAQIGSAATLLAIEAGDNPFDEIFSATWHRLAAHFGSERPIPPGALSATIEYRGQADVDDAVAAGDADNLYRFLARRGLIDDEAGPLPELATEARPLEATALLHAPVPGIVVYRKRLGDAVSAGELIAEIVDPMADRPNAARVPVVSETDGFLLSRLVQKFARRGAVVGKVCGERPLPSRRGTLLED